MFHCITRGGSRGKAGGPPPPHLILGKNKKRIAEGRKAGRASDKQPGPPPPPLAQGPDPLLITTMGNFFSAKC